MADSFGQITTLIWDKTLLRIERNISSQLDAPLSKPKRTAMQGFDLVMYTTDG